MSLSFERVNSPPDENCGICLDGLNDNVLAHNFTDSSGKSRYIHHFHEGCIAQHLNIRNNCPICLKTVNAPESEESRHIKASVKMGTAGMIFCAALGSMFAMATFGIKEKSMRQFTPALGLAGMFIPGVPVAVISGGLVGCCNVTTAERASNHMLLVALECMVVCVVIFNGF